MPEEDQNSGAPSAPPPEGEPAADQGQPGEAAEDRFRPEAIAARVDQLGDETDLERVAREEERKLLERRRQGGKGKRALDAAASKRLAKIGEAKVKRPSAASSAYVPEADPLMERARRGQKWIQQHPGASAAVIAAAVVVIGGGLGWAYWQDRREAEASALLARAFADEHGHISAKDDDDEDDGARAHQLYPTFKSEADRRAAAKATYEEVE
ncbi:MAG: hypothetical protein JOZ69_18470, partial [Myxococcales bacterium]|nr:hypothetical protein [Myxococcales bacterium]